MTCAERKIAQMKLFRLWKAGKIDSKVYGEETLKLLQAWAAENYGKKRAS